jgi:flagellum-specific peptidoglycan hydrolase FlgJ
MKKIIIISGLLLAATITTAQTPDFSKFKHSEYLTNAYDLAKLIHFKYDIHPAVTMAVSILESGYGTSYAARVRCNYFGMNKGRKVYISMYESFNDFGALLRQKKRYKALNAIDTNDVFNFVQCLNECGFNPGKNYYQKLITIIKQYNLDKL